MEQGSCLLGVSKDYFKKEYRRLYYGKPEAEKLFTNSLTELQNAVLEGNLNHFENLWSILEYFNEVEDNDMLEKFFVSSGHHLKRANLVILACQHNQNQILEYIFDNSMTKSVILSKLVRVLPKDEDESCHSAFYYAIRSGNTNILRTLMEKWPDNYFAVHSKELEYILSKTYEELKLKRVPLLDEMEMFVEEKLLEFRFFSNDSGIYRIGNIDFNNIKQRICLVIEKVALLKSEEVNEQFIFIARFIAQNIHILKRLLKSTYIRLPWEEIEFCLTSFILSHTKIQEINVFIQTILNKKQLLRHLEIFAINLEKELTFIDNLQLDEISELPQLKRETVIKDIIKNNPNFESLYKDYQQIRDVHSLKIINDYISLASEANPNEREGQLIITRVLQVVGEYLKNTLESPKLSSTTSELLMLSLPKNTRKIFIDLRNSLSHGFSLSKRMEIEYNANEIFFNGVQNDVKKIGSVVKRIFFEYNMKILKLIIIKFKNTNDVEEIRQILDAFGNIDFQYHGEILASKKETLKSFFKQLEHIIVDKTPEEVDVLKTMNETVDSVTNEEYLERFSVLRVLTISINGTKIDHNILKLLKYHADQIENAIPPEIDPVILKKFATLLRKNMHLKNKRLDNLDEFYRMVYDIFHVTEFQNDNFNWIEDLRDKICDQLVFSSCPIRNNYVLQKEAYQNQLEKKITELKDIFKTSILTVETNEDASIYRKNKKMQAVIEMLVLDILSILDCSSSFLKNNLLFLDDRSPLLTGKSLRNHLAHDNLLIELLSEPSISVYLNAKKLLENMNIRRSLGKLVEDDPNEVGRKFNEDFSNLKNQQNMFSSIESGDMVQFKDSLAKGADINAVRANSWTSLHSAAKGPNFNLFRLLVDQKPVITVKDGYGKSLLHVASEYGRNKTIKYLLGEKKMNVNLVDNFLRTPLHYAAQNGHKDAVRILIKNKANTIAQDLGLPPIMHAINNNHVEVVKVMLEKGGVNVELNQALGGFSPLHAAAEKGCLAIVEVLIQCGANVNAKNDQNYTPLHAACVHGHFEVASTLISKNAEVNARTRNGSTSLYYAVEIGHEDIVKVLLQHEADPNISDISYKNTPLHYAANSGYTNIVKLLLEYRANPNAKTLTRSTPLHLAAKGGYEEIVLILLKCGVNVHTTDAGNNSPLHYASKSGNKTVVQILIRNGAIVNLKGNNGVTPLHLAAQEGHKDIVDFLLLNNADVTDTDINGDTPLHKAVKHEDVVVELLSVNKNIINRRNNLDMTPLHLAVCSGSVDTVKVLLVNECQLEISNLKGLTALHMAIINNQKDIVDLLIENGAKVCSTVHSPLRYAVEQGSKEIIENLIANGADLSDISALLVSAISNGSKEVAEVLIANGADVNWNNGEPLSSAVLIGDKYIVEVLLKHGVEINSKVVNDHTPLHLAARKGYIGIVNVLLAEGACANAVRSDNSTSLHLASQEGHVEVVEVLIKHGAKVNAVTFDGTTPLHLAACQGHNDVVTILLNNQADASLKNQKNKTPLDLATARGNLNVVKQLFEYKKDNSNTKSSDDCMGLHTASQEGNLDVVKYLVEKGSDMNVRNNAGCKPVHLAAREGHADVVEYYITKGLDVNDSDGANQTILHYAVTNKSKSSVVKYLIASGADINAQDTNKLTPMDLAAKCGSKDVIEILLNNGAIYDKRMLKVAEDVDVKEVLSAIENLCEAVKRNRPSEVEKCLQRTKFIDVKNSDNSTLLHHAAWKGYADVVKKLLQNGANINAVVNKGCTPLHYASKFSHLKIVKMLLFYGAKFTIPTDGGKTPSDFAVDVNIIRLFSIITDSFEKVKTGNTKVVNDLADIKDVDTVRAILGARNEEGKSLTMVATESNFPKIEQLENILQNHVTSELKMASILLEVGNYPQALNMFRSAFEKQKELFGAYNPGTLDIQTHIAKTYYAQGAYGESLNILEDLIEKQTKVFGLNDKSTLRMRGLLGLVLHRLGRDGEANNILQEVSKYQKKILGPYDPDMLNTEFHMALVLDRLGKLDEALKINRSVLERRKFSKGSDDPDTIRTENNIADVLAHQGKQAEALKIYRKVLEKKKRIFGDTHVDTLRTSYNIAVTLFEQGMNHEAVIALQDLLKTKKTHLGMNHPETLRTNYTLAIVLLGQGKSIAALKAFRECSDRIDAVFGTTHEMSLDTKEKIAFIHKHLGYLGQHPYEMINFVQKQMNIALTVGDVETVKRLLEQGVDPTDTDLDGRAALHYAVSHGQTNIVNLLLDNGADINLTTNKGNNALHTATSAGFIDIINILLNRADPSKLNAFVNAKTVKTGTTSLHLAAKNGSLDIIKVLLKKGAIFDVKNVEGKTPLDLSKDNCINFLKLVEEVFNDTKLGKVQVINRLKALKLDDVGAILYARDHNEKTLLLIAMTGKHEEIAKELCKLLKHA